jgi:hypothetical protein
MGGYAMKLALPLFALISVTCLCQARPTRFWTYEDLVKESDLVVIATPVESQDLKEPAEFPNTSRVDANGKRVALAAVGVETKFAVQVVLKGEKKELKELVFFHLREPDQRTLTPNGPMTASFDLKNRPRYLMFLKREADGRYISTTGQMDSAVGVKELGTHP